jgi:hypothetical protein
VAMVFLRESPPKVAITREIEYLFFINYLIKFER